MVSLAPNHINSLGYGTAPRLLMVDPRLSIESKAIYTYLSSYTGGGSGAKVSVEQICKELNVGKSRYYKHLKPLLTYEYLTITRSNSQNGFECNLFEFNLHPNLEGWKEKK